MVIVGSYESKVLQALLGSHFVESGSDPDHPVPPPEGSGSEPWPGHINDYARKQWAGLVGDYYAPRVGCYLKQGLADAAAGRPFGAAACLKCQSKLAYEWQTAFGNKYPTEPAGDPVKVSAALRAKYASSFARCGVAAP